MKTKYHIVKVLLAVISVFAVNMSAYADWDNIYQQDFSELSDSEVSELITESKSAFSAGVKNGALELKSDSLCYFRMDNTDNLNGSSNVHGITLQYQNDRFVTKLETPVIYRGVQYDYIGKGNSSVCVDGIENKNAIRQFTYINADKYADENTPPHDALRTNATRFVVDSGMFESTDNRLTVELMYYTDDAPHNWCEIWYPSKDGGSSSKQAYDAATLSNDGTGAWRIARIELTDVDFTRKIDEGNNIRNSIRVESAPGKTNYFYSIAVYRTDEAECAASSENNVFEKKISDDDLYGNVKVTYDMTVPGGISCTDGCEYNSGRNRMSVDLLDSNKIGAASVVYDIKDGTASIYAVSSDDNGDVQYNLLYDGDIKDKAFTYTITTDMKNRTYTVEIFEGATTVGKTDTPVGIMNKNIISGFCKIQYVNVKHNPYSKALLSIFDNVDVSVSEDMDYRYCVSDAEAIFLNTAPDGIVTNDFDLPVSGSLYSSSIEWISSDESAIAVADGGRRAEVKRGDENVSVTLTARVTYSDYCIERQFDFIVKSHAGTYMTVRAPEITTSQDGTVTARIVLKNPGTSGAEKINFIVMSVNSGTGDIHDRRIDSKTDIPIYGSLEFRIDGLQKSAGDEIVWYLWDGNNISLANNAPSGLCGFKVENKVKSINLSWEASCDDYNAVDYYAVYRDGKLIAKCRDTQYKDRQASYLENHSYSVVPVDTNEIAGEGGAGDGCTIEMPFYLTPVGKTEVAINSNGNGISIAYRDDPARAAYTEDAEVTDADGETTRCRYIPDSKYIGLYTDKTKINSKNVAIDFTYLDTEGELIFQYNSVIPDGKDDGAEYALKEINCGKMTNTNTWKVLSVKLDDAQFRESLLLSGADFCLMTKNGSGVYVKKVELAEARLYE
ncbi:MAG: hypothetical protein J6N52_10410 [Clostridia bacterium]|nr:hypothetical protein [Clostridia bacterium]